MLALLDSVFDKPLNTLADISQASVLALVDYFGLRSTRKFLDSRDLGIGGSSSQRLRDIVLALGGTIYITGHGARKYLDHDLFERAGLAVRYMQYQHISYPQLHGPFTPYVTSLDLVANCGKEGVSVIKSPATDWREFLGESA